MTADGIRERGARPGRPPPGLERLVAGRRWSRDLVGESGAAVHRLCAPGAGDLYLKHGVGPAARDVADERDRLAWLDGRLGAPEVRGFAAADGEAWLLTGAVPGPTAYQRMRDDPGGRAAVVDALAAHLRALHALDLADCPFDAGHRGRLLAARRRLEAGEVDASDFGEAHRGWTPARVWDEMVPLAPAEPDLVVTHGDYSLDNLFVADGAVAGMIDVGRLGAADRYQDLAILWDSLGEFGAEWPGRMVRAYGVERVDGDRLRFHLCLDEFF